MANDVTPMIPVDDERDEAIFAAWEAGKSLRLLAREFNLPLVQIEQALDRVLPSFGPSSQLRAYKRELEKLESLSSDFYALAKRDKSPEHAHLVARLNERICAMRGISAINVRMDPYTVEVAQKPTQFEQISAAINRVYMQQPPAKREALEMVHKIGGEKALEILKAGLNGNGAAPSDPDPDPAPDPDSSKRCSVG